MKSDDWNRAVHVDYAHYHLARPRPGYEWREVDGNFVMAAVATGLIATVVAESLAHQSLPTVARTPNKCLDIAVIQVASHGEIPRAEFRHPANSTRDF